MEKLELVTTLFGVFRQIACYSFAVSFLNIRLLNKISTFKN
jgi:hypothetical protein